MYYYHHDDFVIPDDDDQIGRATSCEEYAQYHDRELWGLGRIQLETDVLTEHAELSVAMSGLDE